MIIDDDDDDDGSWMMIIHGASWTDQDIPICPRMVQDFPHMSMYGHICPWMVKHGPHMSMDGPNTLLS